jgi:S-adenosylmethionine synthetase
MTLAVEILRDTPVARRRIELVERKGLGHPDTICDAVVEAISVALNRMYLDRLGRIPHYNLDKALLVAGQTAKRFGGGSVARPIELIVGDRATFTADGAALPVEETLRAAVGAWVTAHLPHVHAGHDLITRSALAPGSAELRAIYDPSAVVASNDTCGASGYAPLSPTETLVLAVEHYLNGSHFKGRFPDTGEDVKVFALRDGDRIALTVAMPLLCAAIASERAYFDRKAEVLDALRQHFRHTPFTIEWVLNALDQSGRGLDGVYLTVTGTSAEAADSGQVGRGNRANGLIAFSRPTGGEAAPGKNPVAHTGKIYSVLSHRLAHAIHRRCPETSEVYVHLAARIGQPVDQPATCVQLVLPAGMAAGDVEPAVREVVATEIGNMAAFCAALIRGEYPVC